uniref:Uncharacterized protein n=1 Tax=Oryza glumipatula TaxID=40148 RepID=A0A0E0A445_9ORYZ
MVDVRRVAVVDSGRGRTGGCRGPMVREDALETKTVTQSRRSLRKMTPKSRCSRTVKDKTSRRICQTRGQLRMNARAEWRQWQLGDAAAMLEVDEEDPERLTMTSADDEVVDARTTMKTTRRETL